MRATLSDLIAAAGLPPLEDDDQRDAPTEIFYVSAARK
jgi:hypothetical protein